MNRHRQELDFNPIHHETQLILKLEKKFEKMGIFGMYIEYFEYVEDSLNCRNMNGGKHYYKVFSADKQYLFCLTTEQYDNIIDGENNE